MSIVDPISLSPDEFEAEVKKLLDKGGIEVTTWQAFEKRTLPGRDGHLEIDASAELEVLGMGYVPLVECKRHRDPVRRDVALALHAKVQSHKGAVFATSGFQKGAIEYAAQHGIALVHVQPGSKVTLAKAEGLPPSRAHLDWLAQPGRRRGRSAAAARRPGQPARLGGGAAPRPHLSRGVAVLGAARPVMHQQCITTPDARPRGEDLKPRPRRVT